MNDVLKGALGHNRIQQILIAWTMPLLLCTFGFIVLILPDVEGSAVIGRVRRVVAVVGINKTLFLLALTFAVSTVMYLGRQFLYRILEGLAWPFFLREWRIRRAQGPNFLVFDAARELHRAVAFREDLEGQLRDAKDEGDQEATARITEQILGAAQVESECERDLKTAKKARRRRGRDHVPWVLKMIPRRGRPLFVPRPRRSDAEWMPYPEHQDQVRATRVGNALGRLETYGFNAYGLDSQLLWHELFSEASEPLREAIDDAELQADTFVCLLYGVVALVLSAAAGAAWRAAGHLGSARLWAVALGCLALVPILHRGLLSSIDAWAEPVAAMVNNGREALRLRYRLRDPATAAEERSMWEAVTGRFGYVGSEEYAERMKAFREWQTPEVEQGASGREYASSPSQSGGSLDLKTGGGVSDIWIHLE